MALVIGYGSFAPVNTTERYSALIAMLIAGGLYAYIIGAICQAVSQRDPGTQKFQQTMDLLNLYMSEIKMPQPDKIRMREFVAQCAGLQRQKFYQEVLDVLSPKLRAEFAERTTGQWIRLVPFFCCAKKYDGTQELTGGWVPKGSNAGFVGADFEMEEDGHGGYLKKPISALGQEQQRFVCDIAMVLNRRAFTRGEMLFKINETAECMYIVQQGVVGAKGSIVRAGQFCGEDMIMASGRRIYRATAMTFVDAQTLSRDDLYQILENGDFPETSKLIHIAALRMAIRKYFKQLVATIKSAHAMDLSHKRLTEEDCIAWKEAMAAKSQTKRQALNAKRASGEIPIDIEDEDVEEQARLAATRGDPVRAVLQQNKTRKEPTVSKLAKMIDKMYTEVKATQAGIRNCSDSVNDLRRDFARHLGVGGMSPVGSNKHTAPTVEDDEMSWRPQTPPMAALEPGQQVNILGDLRRASQYKGNAAAVRASMMKK
jgi:potassium voltage-gated channel Eag-related subfamily H protein 7